MFLVLSAAVLLQSDDKKGSKTNKYVNEKLQGSKRDKETSGHPNVDPVGVSMIQLLKTVSMFCHKLTRN